MAVPLINGIQHSWASVKLNLLGKTASGVLSIEYGDEREMEDHYGEGDEPIMRGQGNKKYPGNAIELFQFEIVALQKAIGGDITQIPPFEIVVMYKATASAPVVIDVIQNCQFKKNMRSLKSGDTKSSAKLDLQVAGIKWHSL